MSSDSDGDQLAGQLGAAIFEKFDYNSFDSADSNDFSDYSDFDNREEHKTELVLNVVKKPKAEMVYNCRQT